MWRKRHREKIIGEENREKIIQVLKEAKEFLLTKEKELALIEEEYIKAMSLIPNCPLDDVPEGKDERENVVIKEVGKKPKFNFVPQIICLWEKTWI